MLFTGNAEDDKKGKAPVLSEMTSDTFVSRDTEEINIVMRMVGNASVTTQEREAPLKITEKSQPKNYEANKIK